MKGIVVEVRGKTVTVLGDDGSVENLRNKGYKVGEVIMMKDNTFSIYKKQLRRFAAVAAAFVFFSAGAYAYSIPVAYVSVDINPSIEYEVNMFDRVLSVKAMDESAVEILALLDINNMNIQKAVRVTTQQLVSSGYIEGEENNIFVVAGSDNTEKAERLAQQLNLRVQEVVDKEGKKADVHSESVSLARVEEAKALEVTPGKLNLVQRLIEIDDAYEQTDQAALLEQSVKEINKEIKASKKDAEIENEENQKEDLQEMTEEKQEAQKEENEQKIQTKEQEENEQRTEVEEQEESQQEIDKTEKEDFQKETDKDSKEASGDNNDQEVKNQKDPNHESSSEKTDKEEKPKK